MKQSIPKTLYSAEQSRQLDRIAIEQFAIPGISLMKRAGKAALQCLLQQWPQPEHITVFCGGGNNGGDGYIVAGLALQEHLPVTLYYLSEPQSLTGDAALARDFAQQAGVNVQPFTAEAAIKGIVVDAMLGTGTHGAPRDHYSAAIDAIGNARLPVLAIDVPSGLNADTGAAPGAVIRADHTITFISVKQGLVTGKGPALCGELHFNALDIPPAAYAQVKTHRYVINYQPLPPRDVDAHKGSFGHVLVVGGDIGMGGAVTMAAEAAARCGSGLVSVATRAEHINAILARRPEIMVKGVTTNADDVIPLLNRASVVVIGPGLGQSEWSQVLLNKVLATKVPKVVDADALNLMAAEAPTQMHRDDDWVLTPHPGEAARLLACDVSDVQNDRYNAAAKLQHIRGGVTVLKGVGTVVAGTTNISICRAGNPGMATGGMGDVLSGVIAALIAQGLSLQAAAECGVQIHAMAADRAARRGQRGLLATDLMPHLRSLVNGLCKH